MITLKFSDLPGDGDFKVLNYALTLETLESQFYDELLLRLTTGGKSNMGVDIPGLGLADSEPDVNYVKKFGKVEREHRDLLRVALNAVAVKPLKYDFGLQNLDRKACGDRLFDIEITGTQAYLGAVPFFATRTFVSIAAAIQGTEARHTAVIASVNNGLFGEHNVGYPRASHSGGRETPVSPDETLRIVAPYIAALT